MNLVSDLLRVGLVDPCGGGQLGRRRPADEPFGVPLVAGVEHDRLGGVHPLGVAVVARVRDVAFRLPRGLRSPSASEVVYAGCAGWVLPDRNGGLLRMRHWGRSATIWWRVARRVV